MARFDVTLMKVSHFSATLDHAKAQNWKRLFLEFFPEKNQGNSKKRKENKFMPFEKFNFNGMQSTKCTIVPTILD